MSIETIEAKIINNEDDSIKVEDLDRAKLAFISFGSLCGMGIGLLFSFIATNNWFKLIVGVSLIFTGLWSIMKSIDMLRK